ncbi:MAG: hypothetical protein KGI29_10565, partial [Pseudomonadota bacterium]|nr:hypothetical protein [Pseudomonadota bacterium]
YVVYHLLALCLVGYAFLSLLHKSPNIAHDLVGPAQVPVIGGGWGNASFGEINQKVRGFFGGGRGADGNRDSRRNFAAARDAIRSFAGQAREQMETLRYQRPIK